MREFGIRFSRGLRKGLRAFPTSAPGEEMVIECYNLMPGENGLLPRDDLAVVDVLRLEFTYFCMRSEIDDVWCIHIDAAGQIVTTFGAPHDENGFVAVSISVEPLPYWLDVRAFDDPALHVFISPDVAGSLTVDYAPPDRAPGFDAGEGLLLQAPNGYRYILSATQILETFARRLE